MSLRGAIVSTVLVATMLSGCDESSTYRLVSFSVEARGAEPATEGGGVDTPLGYRVTLRRMQVSIGPIYFRNAPPSVGTSEDQGRVVAQVLSRFTVDALDPRAQPIEAGGNAATERALSAEVRLAEAQTGPIAEDVGPNSAVAYVAGVAVRNAQSFDFEGPLVLPIRRDSDAYQDVVDRRVLGISADFAASQGGRLTVVVDPTHVCDAMDFESLAKSPSGFLTFDEDTNAEVLRSGIAAAAGVYSFRWEDASP